MLFRNPTILLLGAISAFPIFASGITIDAVCANNKAPAKIEIREYSETVDVRFRHKKCEVRLTSKLINLMGLSEDYRYKKVDFIIDGEVIISESWVTQDGYGQGRTSTIIDLADWLTFKSSLEKATAPFDILVTDHFSNVLHLTVNPANPI